MTEATALAVLPPKEGALAVYTAPDGLDPYLQKIIDECEAFEADVTTVKGRKEIASMAFKVSKAKVALDDIGKELVAEMKEVPKKIDAERRRMRERLDALKDEVRAPLTAWEQAEDDRVQRHKDAIEGIASLVVNSGEPSESIRAAIAAVEAIVIGPEWEEFEPEAARAKDKALAGLRERLTARERYEAEQAELAELRAKAAAQEQKDRDERIAREAAEKAQREADERARAERDAATRRELDAKAAADRRELELKLAAETAEREKAEAVAREAQARRDADEREQRAAAAERQRIADEQAAAAAEVARREADKAHKGKVNRAALAAFVQGGMPEECAKLAVTLIAKGGIPAVKISY